MKRTLWNTFLLLSAGLIVFAAASCVPVPPDGGGNTNTNTNTTNVFGPSGNASPSPSTGSNTLPPGSTVRVGLFGQSGPGNCASLPNSLRQIKVGCTGFVTATPKGPDGVTDLEPAVHGPTITWSAGGATGSVNIIPASNPFNRDVRCLSVGAFTLSAQVKDVTGTAGFECIP